MRARRPRAGSPPRCSRSPRRGSGASSGSWRPRAADRRARLVGRRSPARRPPTRSRRRCRRRSRCPTSARARAGASFTPSPTIATRRPRSCSSATFDVLLLGQHLGHHLVDAELARDGLGDLSGISGDHHDAHTFGVQRFDRGARLGPHGVFQRDRADHSARHRSPRAPWRPEHARRRRHSARSSAGSTSPRFLEQGRPADGHGASVDLGLDPAPCDRPEARRLRQRLAPRPACGDDRAGERMLAVGLDCGGEAQHRVVVAVDRDHRRARQVGLR